MESEFIDDKCMHCEPQIKSSPGEESDRHNETLLILKSVKEDCFTLRDHAIRRSDEHLLSRQNVINVAHTIIKSEYQEDKYTHLFIGFLSEKQPGGFTAVINDGVRVVTVFKRRLSRDEKRIYNNIKKMHERKDPE